MSGLQVGEAMVEEAVLLPQRADAVDDVEEGSGSEELYEEKIVVVKGVTERVPLTPFF